jgi:putative membrane protein
LAFTGLFVGAVSQLNAGLDAIPAAIVNNDEMITSTLPDGSEQQILAGRQLVTELTGADSAGFDWTITNTEDANAMLASGEVYAVLEVPEDFSKSIVSLSSEEPQRADLEIRTDDAHNYLTGSVAQTVGDGLVNTFGAAISEQYVAGLYSTIGQLGGALSTAADGATQIADGAGSLSAGLSTLTDGASAAASGASTLANGTSQYVNGVAQLGGGVGQYAAGVSGLNDGLTQYVSGVSSLSSGVNQYVAGATELSTGVGQYVAGASSLSAGVNQYVGGAGELATGLESLAAAGSQLNGGLAAIPEYTGAVSQLSAALSDASAALDPTDPAAAGVQQLVAALATAADGGAAVEQGIGAVSQYTDGVSQSAAGARALANSGAELSSGAAALASSGPGLSSGASALASSGAELAAGANTLAASGPQLSSGSATLATSGAELASGASTLAASGGELTSGAADLATGLNSLADGAADATTGATALQSGAAELGAGLQEGADQVPVIEGDAATESATVATSPVGLTVTRNNEVSDIGQIIATFFVPLGLWLGAIAIFLVMRPVTRSVLASTAANGRIAMSAISKAGALAAAQAALLVLLMHITLDVSWTVLPATILFSLVMALSFVAVHYLLTVAFGRMGLVLSLLLLAVQLTSTGGLYPIQLLAEPFQVVSPFLPLTYGVAGIQAIIAGGSIGTIVLCALALIGFGLLSLALSLVAVRRVRRAHALGEVQAAH